MGNEGAKMARKGAGGANLCLWQLVNLKIIFKDKNRKKEGRKERDTPYSVLFTAGRENLVISTT